LPLSGPLSAVGEMNSSNDGPHRQPRLRTHFPATLSSRWPTQPATTMHQPTMEVPMAADSLVPPSALMCMGVQKSGCPSVCRLLQQATPFFSCSSTAHGFINSHDSRVNLCCQNSGDRHTHRTSPCCTASSVGTWGGIWEMIASNDLEG
jgi:hypothetical protein